MAFSKVKEQVSTGRRMYQGDLAADQVRYAYLFL